VSSLRNKPVCDQNDLPPVDFSTHYLIPRLCVLVPYQVVFVNEIPPGMWLDMELCNQSLMMTLCDSWRQLQEINTHWQDCITPTPPVLGDKLPEHIGNRGN
jgi:hypothetical protein